MKWLTRWFWRRSEALDILRVIRREQMLFRGHPRFRVTLDRIQRVLEDA